MATFTGPWLSEDEVLFHRMELFHRERVEAVSAGRSPLGRRDDGFLVLHLLPRPCGRSHPALDGAGLKAFGGKLAALGDEGKYSSARFNVDGLLLVDSGQAAEAYSQVFRDGRLEAVMAGVSFVHNVHPSLRGQTPQDETRYFRDEVCQKAGMRCVKDYLGAAAGAKLPFPVTCFSALVGCEGVRFHSAMSLRFPSTGIDRSPAHLPAVEVGGPDADVSALLRSWCDTLLQACGLEGSPNFDESGKWRDRR